jgi:hypothetical protein
MILKLLAVLSVAAFVTGCDPNANALREDVKAIRTDIAEFKKEIQEFKDNVKEFRERATPAIRAYLDNLPKSPPCAAPGKHADAPCFYKLTILKAPASSNSMYQARVSADVVQSLNQECLDKHIFKSRCPKSGDDRTHEFYIDNPPDGLKTGDTVVCESDPKTDHLNCNFEKT